MTDPDKYFQKPGIEFCWSEFAAHNAKSFVCNLNSGLIILDSQAAVRFFNPAAEEMFGFCFEEVAGKEITHLIPALHAHIQNESIQNISQNGLMDLEFSGRRKCGAHLTLKVSIFALTGGGGISLVCVAQDITAQKRNGELLNRLLTVVNRIPASVMITDCNGKIEYVNPCFLKTCGYSLDEVAGNTPRILKSGAHPPLFYQTLWKTILSGKEWVGEFCNKRKDGSLTHELQAILPVKDAAGGITHFISIKIDDTERKRAELQLKRHVKMLEQANEELDNFTSVAAHDLQEPLRKIITLGDRLYDYCHHLLDEHGQDFLGRMQSCSMRMQELIQGLLAYGKAVKTADEFERVDLNEIVAKIIEDLDFRISCSQAAVQVSKLPVIEADKLQMHQLFQNLICNALKFAREGVPAQIKIGCSSFVEGYREIIVEDNGIGFDMKYLNSIFKPFNRLETKDKYPGSGMGLAICQKIVSRHGGMISARSEPGAGARFSVMLPDRQEKKGNADKEVLAERLGKDVNWEIALLEQAPVGMMFAGKDLILRYMNPVSYQILQPMESRLGYGVQDLLDTPLLSFHKNPQAVANILCNPCNLPHTLELQVGPQIVAVTVSVIYDANQDVAGYMAVWKALREAASSAP